MCKPKAQYVREAAWPKIHRVKQAIGEKIGVRLFAKYRLPKSEYVGLLTTDLCEAQDVLRDLGFTYEPIAALKRWRDDTIESGSWVKREGLLHPMQLHVHLFELPGGGVLVAAHYEYSWIRHPVKHYWPREYGHYSPEEGVAKVRTLFEENDITIYD